MSKPEPYSVPTTRGAYIVTGAASGLGTDVARRLLDDGWCVLACDVNAEVDERFAPGAWDGRVRTAMADIAHPDTAEAMIRAAMGMSDPDSRKG